MERIRELLEKLGQLSTEELEELERLIDEETSGLNESETSPELVTQLNELADAAEKVAAEKTSKAEAAAKAEADTESARERIAKARGTEDSGESEESEGDDESEEADEESESEEGAEAESETEAVTASGRVGRLARRSKKPSKSPEDGEGSGPAPAVMVASGALRGVDPSKPIEGRAQLAQAMSDTLNRMSRAGGARGDVILASATWEYPEERKLTDDQAANAEKIEAVIGQSALVASGGICAPVNVDYTVPTYSTAERPLKEKLPGFQVSRGGLRYITPPDLTELEGATGIWTEATDAAPGVETKPLIHVQCGVEEVVYVDAVPTRLGFGNMQGQFSPEYVAANTDLAIAAAARIAENNLLKHIEEACVKNVKTGQISSGVRDVITAVEQAATAYRWLHRIAPNVKLTAIFPEWLKALIKIDLAQEQAHDNSGARDVLAVTDEQVEALIEAHGINPIFHLDGQAEPGSKNYPAQTFAAFTEGGEFKEVFPAKCAWYLFVEGSIQFLDGGRLDLGVVRDSTLDATNDYETFVETFETIAFRGFTHGAIQFVSQFVAKGGVSGETKEITTRA